MSSLKTKIRDVQISKKEQHTVTKQSKSTKPNSSVTQILELSDRKIKITIINLLKTVIERFALCTIRCVISADR